MKCQKCGTENEKDNKFCITCGEKLEESIETEINVTNTGVKIDGKPVVVSTESDGKATASLVLGICAFVIFCLSFPLSVIGLILGLVSKEKSGKRTAGIIINAIVLGLSIICIIIYALLFATAGSIIEKEYDNNNWKDIIEDKKEDDDTKYVGDATFGYVKVPKSWIKFVDVETTKALQYTDIGEGGYIVTLNTIEQDVTAKYAAEAITEGIKGEGASAYYITAKIADYDGYVVKGTYTDGTKIDSYIFLTEDGELRFVSIEGPDRYNKNFDIPKTFTLKK